MPKEVITSFSLEYFAHISVAAIITTTLTLFISKLFDSKTSPDYLDLHKPYLEPKLTIERTNASNTVAKVTITNIGKLPASNIRYFYGGAGVKAIEMNSDDVRSLSPGGTMVVGIRSYENPPPESTTEQILKFNIAYQSVVDGVKRDFLADYLFSIDIGRPVLDNIAYEQSSLKEEKVTIGEAMKSIGFEESLDEDTGSFMFWFNTNGNLAPGQTVFISSKTKSITYDKDSGMLTVGILNTKLNQLSSWSYPVTGATKDWNHVALTWAQGEASLFINGAGPGLLPSNKNGPGEAAPAQ